MKINGGGLEKILGIYKKQGIQPTRAEKNHGTSGASGMDRIELSTEAQDFQAALRALNKVPDLRESKVEGLKAKIASGEYNVNAEEVANRIIDGLFLDRKV